MAPHAAVAAASDEEHDQNNHVFESVDDMLAADDTEYTYVDGWNGRIRIGSLSAGDMIEWTEANEDQKRTAGLRLILKSIVDPQGKRIGNEKKHLELLRQKSHKVTERLVKEILKLNGFNVAEPKKD